jgi:hypothetical protein
MSKEVVRSIDDEDWLIYPGDEDEEDMDVDIDTVDLGSDSEPETGNGEYKESEIGQAKQDVEELNGGDKEAQEPEPGTSADCEPEDPVRRILLELKNLWSNELCEVACKLRDICLPEDKRKIMRFWGKKQKKPDTRVSALKVTLLKEQGYFSKPAWEIPFIFQGDKVPTNGFLFLDVEAINLLLALWDDSHRQVAATIAIVNEAGSLVLWAFISWPAQQVCQYMTSITRLSRKHFKNGYPLHIIQYHLGKILPGNTLVGFGLAEDLKRLDYSHDKLEDLQDFRPYNDENGQPYSLRDLATQYLGLGEIQGKEHSAIIDARVTRSLYKHKMRMMTCPENYPEKKIERTVRPKFKHTPGDWCHCRNRFNKPVRTPSGETLDLGGAYYDYKFQTGPYGATSQGNSSVKFHGP